MIGGAGGALLAQTTFANETASGWQEVTFSNPVTIIANTIRLTLFARRDEIAILRLIGATTSFIRIPYLLEGAVLGGLGSILSLFMLKFLYELFRQQMRTTGRLSGLDNLVAFFPLSLCLALVAVGMALGCAGSFVSLRRFDEAKA